MFSSRMYLQPAANIKAGPLKDVSAFTTKFPLPRIYNESFSINNVSLSMTGWENKESDTNRVVVVKRFMVSANFFPVRLIA